MGYEKKFSEGYVSIGYKILGYEMQEDNTLKIVEEEAEIIREIYTLFANGNSLKEIERILVANGCKNKKGKVQWCTGALTWILDNEKYVGDNLQQKTIVINGVSHHNEGGRHSRQWAMQDVHPPIISRELDDKVKELRAKRNRRKQKAQSYAFTSKIQCGCCCGGYMHKIQNAKTSWACEIWICGNSNCNGAVACSNLRIKDSVLREKFVSAWNEFIETKDNTQEIASITEKLDMLQKIKKELNVLKLKRLITEEYYQVEEDNISKQIAETKQILETHKIKVVNKDREQITEFNEEKFNKYVRKVIIQNRVVTFEFIGGIKVSQEYNNGTSGNKLGWAEKRRKQCNE